MSEPGTEGPCQTVQADLDTPVEVTLKSRRTSGYEWVPHFDDTVLRLLDHEVKRPRSKGFGASAQEVFRFKPLSRGRIGLRFDLVRPWEKAAVDHRDYAIEVA